MEKKAERLWHGACSAMEDRSAHEDGWYATNERAVGSESDYALALKEAQEGDERAQRYIAKFMELRMAG